jgi:hypothetical protein
VPSVAEATYYQEWMLLLDGSLGDIRPGSFGDFGALGFSARGRFGIVEGRGGVKEEGKGGEQGAWGGCTCMWSYELSDFLMVQVGFVYTLSREKKNRGGMKT